MIAAVVTAAAVAAASAFVPAVPIEAYLVAVIATTGADPVALGVAAGLGQTAGKLLTFLAAASSGRAGSGDGWDGAPDPDRWTGRRRVARGRAYIGTSRWPANAWPRP